MSECLRIFDVNPARKWPLPSNNIVLAGRPFVRMPFVVDDIQRPTYKKDGEAPITWFLCLGSVRDQRDTLFYEVLPFLREMGAGSGEILWCPCPDDVEGVDFRQDLMTILDACEKLEEYNYLCESQYKIGLAKMWLPIGEKFERQRVYHCRLNAGLDIIGYYYIQCRVLALGNFTTTDDKRKGGAKVDVECHGDRLFVEEEYLVANGYKLKDYCLRTVRQRIRKLLCDEGVEPKNWNKSKVAGLI